MTIEPSESMKKLAKLIETADADGIRQLGKVDPSLRAELDNPLPGGHFGATPLLMATNKGNAAMIDALLDIGANIDGRSHWWAGSFGVLDGDPKLAPHLISRGATIDINAASHLGLFDRVKELLDADPSLVNHRGGDGQTPLHVAATVEIADLLLDNGANVNARDVDHESTPAQYAIGERIEVARQLVARGSETDILLACALGDVGLVKKLTDGNLEVVRTSVNDEWFPKKNSESGGTIYIWTLGSNKTPQQVARLRGHHEVVRLLQDRSPAEVNLSEACVAGNRSGVQKILADHPDLKSWLLKYISPRFVNAAMDRQIETLVLMLEIGCPVDATNSGGATALHWAAFHGDLKMAQLLLDAGAPLEVADKHHHAKPMGWMMHGSQHGWYCKTGDYSGIAKAFLNAGATPPTTLGDSDASPTVLKVLRNYHTNT